MPTPESQSGRLHTGRIEAFSDGVLAIIITIMVLELKAPATPTFGGLIALWPTVLSYILSFIYVGIYWNNHHHLFAGASRVNGGIMWSNLHLLFWLSLIPFVTDWMGENHFAPLPTACYGVVLLMAAIAYKIMQTTLLREPANRVLLAPALGSDLKGRISPLLYIFGIVASLYEPLAGSVLYVLVAIMWLIPDRRIECAIVEIEGR